MRTVTPWLALWLGISGVILWWLHRNELVPDDEVRTMVAGALVLGAFASGLLVAAGKSLVGR